MLDSLYRTSNRLRKSRRAERLAQRGGDRRAIRLDATIGAVGASAYIGGDRFCSIQVVVANGLGESNQYRTEQDFYGEMLNYAENKLELFKYPRSRFMGSIAGGVAAVLCEAGAQAVPVKHKPATGHAVKGQGQLAGGTGQFGTIYSLNNGFNYEILSAAYSLEPIPAYSLFFVFFVVLFLVLFFVFLFVCCV